MRVLLVEDDTATSKSIELILKSAGMVVDATQLGEDGLEIGKLYDYDIIILDLGLPDIDGMEVLRRLPPPRGKPGEDQAKNPLLQTRRDSPESRCLREINLFSSEVLWLMAGKTD